MTDADKLIYEKSNTYRLHADNLRWFLLGGYAAFFGATIQIAKTPAMSAVFFSIALLYLFVLAVQNWFYNLFACFVKECENRLANDKRLRPLEDFAEEKGGKVNPFHPAFFFAMLTVLLSAVAFLAVPMKLELYSQILFVVGLYFALHFCFKRWNQIIYLPLIKKYTNLYN